MSQMSFDRIADAIEDIRAGKMVVVLDSEDRENEGDLIMAAEKISAESVNFMASEGRGLICTPLEVDWLERLELPQMANDNTAKHSTRFTISIDLLAGTTTGISAADRALTIAALADCQTTAAEFGRPGHVFPLESESGGVLKRPGHTEAAVDLCRLAGLAPVGALCEIMSADGSMARTPELMERARSWGLRIITITDLIAFLRSHAEHDQAPVSYAAESNAAESNAAESYAAELAETVAKTTAAETIVERVVDVAFPTRFGDFRLHMFKSHVDGKDHLALVKGDISGCEKVLTRIHSECLTGDTLGSMRCDCGAQLSLALERIESEGRGVVLYMRQEGRGIGLANKIKAYALQDTGIDTVEANHKLGFEADLREYAGSASMLKVLGVESVELMTNNPQKVTGLVANGITVVSRSGMIIPATAHNERYLRAKRDKLGHLFGAINSQTLCSGA